MKYYQITRVNSKTGEKTNYGINSEADMKIITKGYRQDHSITDFYNRKNSKFFFIVKEV